MVCGSTQGIGRASAFALARLGASITLAARDEGRLVQTCGVLTSDDLSTDKGQSHDWIIADFADPAAVQDAIAGALDDGRSYHILINNTGGPPGGSAIDATPEAYQHAFTMHLVSNQILAQAVVPHMRAARYGRIINIISTSVRQPIPGLGVSNTVRGAVASWAKTLSRELAPDGITVNNILPGFTETTRLLNIVRTRAQASGQTEDQVADQMRSSVPAGRFGQPEEVAAAIAFFASPAAGYINGQSLAVDGGRLMAI